MDRQLEDGSASPVFVHLSFVTWVVLAIQTGFLVLYFATIRRIAALPWAAKAEFVATNYVVTIAYFQFVGLMLRRRGGTLRIVNLASVLTMLSLLVYRYVQQSPLDFDMFHDTVGLLRYRESYGIVWGRMTDRLPWWAVGLVAATAIGLVGVAFATRWMAYWPRQLYGRTSMMFSLGLLLIVFGAQLSHHNELTYFVRTACARLFAPSADTGYHYLVGAGQEPWRQLPYRADLFAAELPGAGLPSRPHVFIVLIESFNANFVGTRNEAGLEYTPFFNSLRSQGLTVERFYGNSMQTARAEVAILCGVPPSFRRRISERVPPPDFHALPRILRDAGYQTFFMQSYRNLEFDNIGSFAAHLGFEHVRCMDGQFVTEQDKPYVWGWGLQDDRFFQKSFGYLDSQRPAGRENRPVFAVLVTGSNHMGFDEMPQEMKHLYPRPANESNQKYANSVYLADGFLREFFRQLEQRDPYRDALVIVMGDHSFPVGEHGNWHNEKFCYEESFRTSFVMLWPGRLRPCWVRDIAYSQLDIGPTLLDLLDLQVGHHFRLGRSMLRQPDGQRPIHLVQAYDGTYLAAVIWPMKYVYHKATEQETLFDLERDPNEGTNILPAYEGSELLERLRDEVDVIELNQRMIEHNRIWKPN